MVLAKVTAMDMIMILKIVNGPGGIGSLNHLIPISHLMSLPLSSWQGTYCRTQRMIKSLLLVSIGTIEFKQRAVPSMKSGGQNM